VPELGFTQAALARGAGDAGYSPISTTVLIDGPFSLIRYHLVTQRLSLGAVARELLSSDNTDAPLISDGAVRTRVERLTWERLFANRNIIRKWQEVG
jgi:ubiquinone biosynthesis protein COQ9